MNNVDTYTVIACIDFHMSDPTNTTVKGLIDSDVDSDDRIGACPNAI
jgi:hypothetical protein